MFDFLTSTEITIAASVASLGVGMSPIGTKVKDWFKGIPSDLRTALNDVESDAATKLKAAVAPVVAKKPASPAAAAVAAAAVAVAASIPAPATPPAPGAPVA